MLKGEALGINKVVAEELAEFKECLQQCDDNDYFEKGIEFMIEGEENSRL